MSKICFVLVNLKSDGNKIIGISWPASIKFPLISGTHCSNLTFLKFFHMMKHHFASANEIHKSESTIKSKLELCDMTIVFDSICSILNVFVLFCSGFFFFWFGGFVLFFVLRSSLMQTKGTISFHINKHY